MSVETINDHVLLAEPADWKQPPEWKLTWDTEIAGTLSGNEGRSALRDAPRPTLQFSVQVNSAAAQARLAATITEGLASGRCCAPTYGRASWVNVAAAAGDTFLRVDPLVWLWTVGDWLMVYGANGAHQTLQITAFDTYGNGWTLSAALAFDLPVDAPVYPLFFGRLELDDIEQISAERSTVPVRLVGDKHVISQFVPLSCRPTSLDSFDFVVIRYRWGAGNGTDLDSRTAIIYPPVEGEVGIDRQARVPFASLTPFLWWAGDNEEAAGSEAVLVDFASINAAYPEYDQIIIRLRANWTISRGDGNFTLQFASYRGGTMTQVGDDFINEGGVALPVSNVPSNVASNVHDAHAEGQDCGTFVYNPLSRTAVFIPPVI